MIKYLSVPDAPAEMIVYNSYKNSPEKILIFNWERWLYLNSSWHDVASRGHLCKLQFDNLLIEIKKYDICFFLSWELIDMSQTESTDERKKFLKEFLAEIDKLNVFYISSSEDTQYPTNESRTFNMPWFANKKIYTSKDTTIDFDYRQKDFTFNMLLGADRSYRTQMFERFRHYSCVYSTYVGHPYHRKNLLWQQTGAQNNLDERDVSAILDNQDLSYQKKVNTMKKIEREKQNYSVSCIVPKSIYNNSHFDIVAESQSLRDSVNFTTEKTGKPLSTGRFFIWYNSPHKVEYLKKFGFELQDYLCEYDNIIDADKRLESIFELIKEIGDNENYIKKIYKDTKEARIHNQEVFKKLSNTTTSDILSWTGKQIDTLGNKHG